MKEKKSHRFTVALRCIFSLSVVMIGSIPSDSEAFVSSPRHSNSAMMASNMRTNIVVGKANKCIRPAIYGGTCRRYTGTGSRSTYTSMLHISEKRRYSDCTRLASKDTSGEDEEKDENNNNNNDDDNMKEPSLTLAELAQMEENASRKNLEQLLLPNRISEAVTKLAWLFVLSGFALNAFGYGYVVKSDVPFYQRIQIDTLENRQFQMEVRKSMKQQPKTVNVNQQQQQQQQD